MARALTLITRRLPKLGHGIDNQISKRQMNQFLRQGREMIRLQTRDGPNQNLARAMAAAEYVDWAKHTHGINLPVMKLLEKPRPKRH